MKSSSSTANAPAEIPQKKRHLSLIDDDDTTCGLELRSFHHHHQAPSPGATSISPHHSRHVGMADHHGHHGHHDHHHIMDDEDEQEENHHFGMMDARVDCVPILTDDIVVPIDGQQIDDDAVLPKNNNNKSYQFSIGSIFRLRVSTKKCHILLVLGLVILAMGTILIARKAKKDDSSASTSDDPTVGTMEPSAYYKALETILEPASRNDPEIAKFLNNATMWNDPMSAQYLALEWMAFRDHQFLAPNQKLQDKNAVKQRFAVVTFFYMAEMQLYYQDQQDQQEGNNDNTEWLQSGVSECEFAGITCNARDQVIEMNLVRTAMTGYLPLELGWLSHLEHLNLSENKLNGHIPQGLLQLPKLKYLNLASNHMGGQVESLPPNLLYLNLEHNRFHGSLPASFPNSLVTAKLSRNRWSGSLPEFHIGNHRLEFLDLVDNTHINGTIPTSIGHLTNLQVLSIAQTQLEGTLPTEIGLLDSLEEINMGMTNLSGSLPDEFFELSALQWLVAAHHQFEGPLSPLIAKLQNLHVLNLVHGTLSGPLPIEALASLKNLAWLQLADNQFTGTIRADLAKAWKLEKIWFHGNDFHGSIPTELCDLPAAQLDFRTDCKSGDIDCSCCTLCY